MAHIDLNAILEGEQGFPYTFTFGVNEYTMPPQMDARALMAMSQEKIGQAMEIQLGAEQYQAFMKEPGFFGQERFKALMKDYARHQGETDMGNSSASGSSSVDTQTPSKLTLPGITESTSGAPSAVAS